MNYDNIKQEIQKIHEGDENQLNIIFSEENRIIVEAPAGCGKTKTLISKIAYAVSRNEFESTKKIMALTFSVNAAYKIKKDVYEQLPKVLKCDESKALELVNKIYVSNYHGFSRKIINKYAIEILGYGIDINKMQVIDDSNSTILIDGYGIEEQVAEFMSVFADKIKKNDIDFINDNWEKYNMYVKVNIIPKNVITYNSIILLAYELLNNKKIQFFYQKLFPIIFIDEFQDTNYIAWMLIQKLIGIDTKIVVLGDHLQRIYGFIGALPNLMAIAKDELQMSEYKLEKNYRFRNNVEMLTLDKNIRLNAISLENDDIKNIANPEVWRFKNQQSEASWIVNKALELFEDGHVAILVRNGVVNNNTKKIVEVLDANEIEYFYALFTDEDEEYKKFHLKCLEKFNALINGRQVVTNTILNSLKDKVIKLYDTPNRLVKSLIKLLESFCEDVLKECSHLSQEEKIRYIQDVFENNGLKQWLEKMDEKIILATVHACKGLEYDYVIIADNEQNSFPSYLNACKDCYYENKVNPKCKKRFKSSNDDQYYEELSVFYVAFTRAKKKVFFTLSQERLNYKGVSGVTNGSCFLKFKGIEYKNFHDI